MLLETQPHNLNKVLIPIRDSRDETARPMYHPKTIRTLPCLSFAK
jgi:hypothetical protein